MNTLDVAYDKYSMIIEWNANEQAYIVTVPELPGCKGCGATRREAVTQAQSAILDWIKAANAAQHPIPQPKTFTYWSPFEQAVETNAAQSSSAKS